jgi:hypothetical protein
MLMAASLLSQSAPADDPAGILPMQLLLRDLCPDAFAPLEAQFATGYGRVVLTTPEVLARLAAALDARLASGAVDHWL